MILLRTAHTAYGARGAWRPRIGLGMGWSYAARPFLRVIEIQSCNFCAFFGFVMGTI